MKRIDLIKLYNALNNCELTGRAFTYFISKNKEILEAEIKHIEKYVEPSEEYKEFLKKIDELKMEHAVKDEAGDPVINTDESGKQTIQIDDKKALVDAAKALEEENKELVEDDAETQRKYREEFLEEEVSLDLEYLKFEDVPEDIDQKTMDGIISIIKRD